MPVAEAASLQIGGLAGIPGLGQSPADQAFGSTLSQKTVIHLVFDKVILRHGEYRRYGADLKRIFGIIKAQTEILDTLGKAIVGDVKSLWDRLTENLHNILITPEKVCLYVGDLAVGTFHNFQKALVKVRFIGMA